MKQLYSSFFLFLVIYFFSINLHGQVEVVWDKTIGSSGFDFFGVVAPAHGGGYLLGGSSKSPKSEDKSQDSHCTSNNLCYRDIWLVKTDENGNIEWDRVIGGTYDEDIHTIIPTADGGYLLGGGSTSDISGDKTTPKRGNWDYWLVKISSTGEVLWDKTYGGSGGDYGSILIEAIDGGYFIGGYSNSGVSGDKTEPRKDNATPSGGDFWVLRLNNNGGIIWDKTLGGDGLDVLKSAVATPDGGFILGGRSNSDISGDKTEERPGSTSNSWVIRINKHGEKVWDRTYNGAIGSGGEVRKILALSDGNYLLANSASGRLGSIDYSIIKVTPEGNIIWDRIFGGNNIDHVSDAAELSGGGFIFFGVSTSGQGYDKSEEGKGFWVIRTDQEGNKLWDKTIKTTGGQSTQTQNMIVESATEFIFSGESDSNAGGDKSQDSKGEKDYWLVKLQVTDETPPQITNVPSDITEEVTAGKACGANVSWELPTVTDGLSSFTLISSHKPGDFFPVGTTTVTYTATDAADNTSTASFTVTVADKQAPRPDLENLSTLTHACGLKVSSVPTATDLCDGDIQGVTSDPLEYREQGTYTITWRYTDKGGNSSTQIQKVIIKDEEAPHPAQDGLPPLFAECKLKITEIPGATDNCDGNIQATTDSPLNFEEQGEYTILWEYIDKAGNSTTQEQKVVIRDEVAPVPLVLELPDLTGECSLAVTNIPQAEDNCLGPIAATTNDPLEYSVPGTYTIHWTFADQAGNSIIQEQQVLVEDQTAPVPELAELPDLLAQCELEIEENDLPVAKDNCQGSIKATTTDPLEYTKPGTYSINWKYIDAAGNTSTQKQQITIQDTEAPQPAEEQLPTLYADCHFKVSTIPTAVDNCIGSLNATTEDPLEYNVQGSYTIHWLYDDGHGNTLTQEQQIVVADAEAPVITALDDIVVTAPEGSCEAVVNFSAPAVSDNCGLVSLERIDESGLESGEAFPAGVTTLRYQALDAAGNATEASFTVTVLTSKLDVVLEEFSFAPIAAGTEVSLSAFYSGSEIQEANWQWGDGSSSPALIEGDKITGNHTFTTAGIYPVNLLVKESCGQERRVHFFAVNIYNPEESNYISVSGWFYLNSDAFNRRQQGEEKAYLNLIHNPETKQSAMLLEAAEHTFTSQQAEVLKTEGGVVILEGAGTLDGKEGFTYRLTVADAENSEEYAEDRLRLQLFHPSGKLVLDTQEGAEEGSEPGTAFEEGDIILKGNRVLSIEKMLSAGIKVYPVPLENKLFLQLPLKLEGKLELKIFSLEGKPLTSEVISNARPGILYQLSQDFSSWKRGIYILILRTEKEVFQVKLMK